MQNKLKSIFEQPINVSEIVIGQSSDIKRPTEKQSASRIANAYHELINVVPTISQISEQECRDILVAENREALSIVKSLYKSKSTSYSKNIENLIEIIPQLVASLTRTVSTFKPDVRELLIKDPLKLINSIEKLQRLSINQSSDNSIEFRKTLSELLTIFSNVEAATSKNLKEDPITRITNCFASISAHVQSQDIDQLNNDLIHFQSLEVNALSFETDNTYLLSMDSQIKEIIPIISDLYAQRGKIETDLANKLEDIRNNLVKIINKETKNPFEYIQSLKSTKEIQETINKSRSQLDHATSHLISSIQKRDKQSSIISISEIINAITIAEAAMFRGYEITNCNNLNIYSDFLRMFNSSMNSMNQIMEIATTSSVSSIAVRRSTRSFARMLNSMVDIMEDSTAPSYREAPTGTMDKARFKYIKAASDAIKFVTTAVSARALSKIPETYELMLSKELPRLEAFVKNIQSSSEEIVLINTDKRAGEEFTSIISELSKTFSHFKAISAFHKISDKLGNSVKLFSKLGTGKNATIQNEQKGDGNSLFSLTSSLTKIGDILSSSMRTLDRLTDIVPLAPDLENAQKLKKKFAMPSVPSDSSKIGVIEGTNKLNTLIQSYRSKISKLVEDSDKAKNDVLADEMNDVYATIKEVILQVLRVSTATMNLEFQSELATCCSTIVTNYDSLLKELKSRFLLCGDWDGQSANLIATIDKSLNNVQEICNRASQVAKEEEQNHSAIIAKYNKVLSPLTEAQAALEDTKEVVSTKQPSISREYALQMIEISVAISSALTHLTLYTKAHDPSSANSDYILAQSESIIPRLQKINDVSIRITSGKVDEQESLVVEQMKAISEFCDEFDKSYNTTSDDEKTFKDSINTFNKGAKSLLAAAEASLNAKKQRKEKPATISIKPSSSGSGAKLTIQGSLRPPVAKETLLQRLQFESRVIRARLILEKSEKLLAEFTEQNKLNNN